MPYTRERLSVFSQSLWFVHNRSAVSASFSDGDWTPARPPGAPADGHDLDEEFLADLIAAHLRSCRNAEEDTAGTANPKKIKEPRLRCLGLTARECEVMDGLILGLSDIEIGVHVSCATKTVGKHVEHILAKLGAETRLAAVWTAQERLRAQNR